MPNWNKIVASANAEKFKFPSHEGWVTREKVAEELDCSPERVPEVLSVAIRSGAVETRAFTVWDSAGQRKTRVIGYREVRSAAHVKGELAEGSRIRHRRSGRLGTISKDRGKWVARWDSKPDQPQVLSDRMIAREVTLAEG
jgi:hypothetical protein